MCFTELARTRFSAREYDITKPVSREVIDSILEVARLAPSARNRQPWSVLVVDSPEKRKELNRVYGREWFSQAPVVLVFYAKLPGPGEPYEGLPRLLETDVSIFTTFVHLAAAERGLGSCWIAAFDDVILREVIPFRQDEIIYSIAALGWLPENHVSVEDKKRKVIREFTRYV